MTASARRRRRNTIVAGVLAVVAALLAVGITAVGASTLVNSRAGRDAAADRLPVALLPVTPTALVAVVDDAGRLTTMAVLVLDPSGVGGSIVPLPVSADSSLDIGDDRFPLDETYEVEGVEVFVGAAEAMTAVSFDVVEIVTADRIEEIVGRFGSIEVELPVPLVDDDEPAPVVEVGPSVLTAEEVAAALTASTETQPDRLLDPARAAIWAGLAGRVGAGTGEAGPVGAGAPVPTPADLDEFLDRLFSGRVGFRELVARVPPAERNPRDVDVVVLDRAEVLLVFSQIAPARVATPNESLTFRIEVGFDDADLVPFGINNADVARDVINRLLFARANVVSVTTDAGDVPDVSRATVVDPSLIDRVEEGWIELLGDIVVEPAEFQLLGIDATIVVGRSYLELREVEEDTGEMAPGGLTEPTELGPTDDDPPDADEPGAAG